MRWYQGGSEDVDTHFINLDAVAHIEVHRGDTAEEHRAVLHFVGGGTLALEGMRALLIAMALSGIIATLDYEMAREEELCGEREEGRRPPDETARQ